MMPEGAKEVLRGILVTLIASVGGALFGTASLGINPIGGLSLSWITLFGVVTVLLATYFWARSRRGATRRSIYTAVIAFGLIGGVGLIVIFLSIAGKPFPEPNIITGKITLVSFSLYGIGALYGSWTAVIWALTHYITRVG